jgi:hypothetical protein
MAAHTVDFYLYARHEIPTWRPLLAALRERGADPRIVLEPPSVNLARGSAPDSTRGWLDDKSSNLVPLVDAATYQAFHQQLLDLGEPPLPRLRPGADAAITSAGARWLRPWTGARIRCMYGIGLVQGAWGHGSINDGFDLVLAPGEFSRREIARRSDVPVAVVGYPKWAAHRRRPLERSFARATLGLADDERSMLLWLPTWADHSSLDSYAPAFAALSSEFLVVIKPHHNSTRFERQRLAQFGDRASDLMLVEPSTDLAELVAAADVVVSDVRSGALTEGLLGDRPVVALADPSTEPDVLHPHGQAAVELCTNPAQLSDRIAASLQDGRGHARAALVADLFGPSDGADATRAAAAILDQVQVTGHPFARRVTAPAWRAAYRVARRVGR